MLILAFLVAAS